MQDATAAALTWAESQNLRRLAGIMIPASTEYGVPGADDPVIFADILRSLGRDHDAVRRALTMLDQVSSEDFAALDDNQAHAAANALLADDGPIVAALGRAILQCYYRDDRVITALGLEPRAPFPLGHVLEPSDWSLLEPVRGRARMWRDV